MNNNNIDTTITTIPPKDMAMIEKLFLKMSDADKLLLLENVMNGTITSKDVAIYEMTLEKLKKEVIAKVYPYIREGAQIVYFVPSKNQYKARIPKALLKEDVPVPQCAVTELQMWDKLHKYLYGDSEKNTLEKVYEEWIKERKLDLDVSSKTYDKNVNTWNKYYKGNPITQIPMSKLTTNSIFKFYKSYTAGRAISRAELGNLKGIMNMVFDYAVNNGIVPYNTAKTVSTKVLKCKIVNNKDKVYTPEERAKLFQYLGSIPQIHNTPLYQKCQQWRGI